MPAPIPSTRSSATSLTFITVGAILAVICGTSYVYFGFGTVATIWGYLRACGLLLGLTLVAIGVAVGFMGKTARRDDATSTEKLPANTPPSLATNPANMFTQTTNQPGNTRTS